METLPLLNLHIYLDAFAPSPRLEALLSNVADVLHLLGEVSINTPPVRPSRFYTTVLSLDAAADQFIDLWLHTVSQDV